MKTARIGHSAHPDGNKAVIEGEYGDTNGKVVARFKRLRDALAWMKANGYVLPDSQPSTSAAAMWRGQ